MYAFVPNINAVKLDEVFMHFPHANPSGIEWFVIDMMVRSINDYHSTCTSLSSSLIPGNDRLRYKHSDS